MTFISWLAKVWVFREYQLTGKRISFSRNKRLEKTELTPPLVVVAVACQVCPGSGQRSV